MTIANMTAPTIPSTSTTKPAATVAHILGFPRIGAQRELKFAQEAYWHGTLSEKALQDVGTELRARHWHIQKAAGLDFVCVGDFAWYDQMLSTLALLGGIPARFGFDAKKLSLADYFTLARGNKTPDNQPLGVTSHLAMEMTKWFDTNYHYLVPEWTAETTFDGGVDWLFDELAEAQALGHRAKVTLISPLTLLYLGKIKDARRNASPLLHKLDLLDKLIPAYQRVLARLAAASVEWVQIDEPILTLALDARWQAAFQPTYEKLRALPDHHVSPKILLATYFESVSEHAALLHKLPIDAVHVDLVRAPQQLPELLKHWPRGRVLSAGVIDGRNIWRADLAGILKRLQPLHQQLGAQLWLGSSCSLLHVPVDLVNERNLDEETRSWLAFAAQKLDEIFSLQQALNGHLALVQPAFSAAQAAIERRRTSGRIHHPLVKQRLNQIKPSDATRQSPFSQRIKQQQARLQLPQFPTTTIGSFPQTPEIRAARAAHKNGKLGHLDYLNAMRAEIRTVIAQQEKLGIDVLVHGEPERNDMVEYFGEQLQGYGFTLNGWVQSYGSRCVKPPFIYGDVYRPEAMTIAWSQYAQSLTKKPMKGMLTGPVTMLQWSFVRDDQPRETTALQIALALRDEVCDLEKAGIRIIQIDEPAFREGLPLKTKDWPPYLDWAVRAFKLCAAGVADTTQIHTHMCYSEFNDILPWIAAMDADVITIETSRSDMELLDGFGEYAYPNDIGPGVYDIHAPRTPSVLEIQRLLQKAREVIPDGRLWVNPDCGLKTRSWAETIVALENMVQAAQLLRTSLTKASTNKHTM